MKRHLLNLLTAISLTLCVAMIVLWPRSYRSMDFAGRRVLGGKAWQSHHLISNWGSLTLARATVRSSTDAEVASYAANYTPRHGWFHEVRVAFELDFGPRPTFWQRNGFNADFHTHPSPWGSMQYVEVRIPYWLLILCAVVMPAERLRRYLRRRRQRSQLGRCRVCGYDLRATPGRCPECGAAAGSAGERETVHNSAKT